MKNKIKKIAILTNGGDAPGLNAVIRAIVKTAEKHNIKSYGYIDGFRGLLNNEYVELTSKQGVDKLLSRGGTVIGTSNSTNLFNFPVQKKDGKIVYEDLSDMCIANVKKLGFDYIFALGGDGTQKSARDFAKKGLNIIGIPKTIDNDVACTDITFGYNTAVQVATDALDRLHTTAETHHRIMVLEVMGRFAGWIALESAISGGADAALIPEIPYDINKVVDMINNRIAEGKQFSVVVVSEGAKPINGESSVYEANIDAGSGISTKFAGAGDKVAKDLERLTGLESRNTTLGYMQRGGTPSAYDRVLSTQYGAKAMELALEGKFGVLTVMRDGKFTYVDLEDVVGNNKELGAVEGGTEDSNVRLVTMDHPLVQTARDIGICLGD